MKTLIDLELPILIIAAGILLLVAHLSSVPAPKWLVHSHDNRPKRQ